MNIAILSQTDKLWCLSTIEKLLNEDLPSNARISGIIECDPYFVKGRSQSKYYLSTFGIFNFLKLGIFYVLYLTKRSLQRKPMNFQALCSAKNISYFYNSNPNSKEVYEWISNNNIDYVIIFVGHILKGDIVRDSRFKLINKHASLLPSFKGVFPYFWAFLNNAKQGISFHFVDKGIDTGQVIYQEEVDKVFDSMIGFYHFDFNSYSKRLAKALENTSKLNQYTSKDSTLLKPSYYGLPTREDYLNFSKKGGKIITLRDLLLGLKL